MASYPSRRAIKDAADEMRDKPPRQLAKTARKFGKKRAAKQRVAILLSKARRGSGKRSRRRG